MNFVSDTSTTSVLVSIYLLVYGTCGILAGLFIKSIISIIANKKEVNFYLPADPPVSENVKQKIALKTKVIWVWLVTVTLIVLAFYFFGGDLLGWQKAVYVLLRSFLILMIWYLVLGPFLLKLIRKYLNKKESQYKEDVANAMDLFPYFRQIISYTWKETKYLKGYTRFKYFMANSIYNCIHFKVPSE
jgi:hypothetical protein